MINDSDDGHVDDNDVKTQIGKSIDVFKHQRFTTVFIANIVRKHCQIKVSHIIEQLHFSEIPLRKLFTILGCGH